MSARRIAIIATAAEGIAEYLETIYVGIPV